MWRQPISWGVRHGWDSSGIVEDEALELAVDRVGGPVGRVLGCRLGVAQGLLALALHFLNLALGLELVRPDHLAGSLFDVSRWW